MLRSKYLSLCGIAFAISTLCTSPISAEIKAENESSTWSAESNDLRARLHLHYSHVFNGTGIVVTYLELQNVSEVIGSTLITIDQECISFNVRDADGQELPMPGVMRYSSFDAGVHSLALPFDSSIRFRYITSGRGVGGDKAAQIDLGRHYGWELPHDEKDYYLKAVVKIPESKQIPGQIGNQWHGRLELPPVLIPTEPMPIDPENLGEIINDLGARMLSKNSSKSEAAGRKLSLIDDARVVPWYIKAMKTKSSYLKFSALDRLSRFDGDAAFEGLKIGAATQSKDIGNVSRPELAISSAESVRSVAVGALARSSHPKAKELLFSMHEDPAKKVRLSVIQAIAKMDTPESLALLKSHRRDSDITVRQEVDRLLKRKDQKESKSR